MEDFDLPGDINRGAKIGQAIGNAICQVLLLFSRPIGLVTQVFFRKDFGVRYFTGIHLGGAVIVILFAMLLTGIGSIPWTIGGFSNTASETRGFTWVVAVSIAVAWIVRLIVVYREHIAAARKRFADKVDWHSRCSGMPRYPSVTNGMQYGQTAAAGILLILVGFPFFGILVLMSLGQVSAADAAAANALIAALLDDKDAKIENEIFQAAKEKRSLPEKTKGVFVRLPKYFQSTIHEGDHRVAPRPAVEAEAKPA